MNEALGITASYTSSVLHTNFEALFDAYEASAATSISEKEVDAFMDWVSLNASMRDDEDHIALISLPEADFIACIHGGGDRGRLIAAMMQVEPDPVTCEEEFNGGIAFWHSAPPVMQWLLRKMQNSNAYFDLMMISCSRIVRAERKGQW